MSKPGLLWFRKDLRLHDNPVLHRALDEADALLPVSAADTLGNKKYEREFKKNISTYWLIFELKWAITRVS